MSDTAERIADLERRFAARGHHWRITPIADLTQFGYAACEGYTLVSASGEIITDEIYPTLDDIEEFVVFQEDCAKRD